MPYLRKPSYLPLAGPSHFRSGLVTSGRIPPLPAEDVSYWFPAPGRPVTFQPNWNCHKRLHCIYYNVSPLLQAAFHVGVRIFLSLSHSLTHSLCVCVIFVLRG